MNSRQNQRGAMTGRSSVLLVSFPTVHKRSSSPPLMVTQSVTNQFVRFGDSGPAGQYSSLYIGRPSSKILRENNNPLQNSIAFKGNTFSGKKKSFSALDLRAAQRIFHEPAKNFLPRKENLNLAEAPRPESGARNLSRTGVTTTTTTAPSAKLPADTNAYSNNSILKKSAFKNQPGDYHYNHHHQQQQQQQSGYIDAELLAAVRSKRKVIFKNKVSVFRFDSDGVSSECDRRTARNHQVPSQNQRRYRTMTPRLTASPIRNSLQSPPPHPPLLPPPPLISSSLKFVPPFRNRVIFPASAAAPTRALQEESASLILGEEASRAAERVQPKGGKREAALSSSASTSTVADSQSQQNQYESIPYCRSPAGSFEETTRDPDAISVSHSSVSSRSSRATVAGSKNSKLPLPSSSSKDGEEKEEKKEEEGDKQTSKKKEAKFSYHVIGGDSNKLVVSVRLGLTLHPNDVLVKANKIGTKLRIVANPESNSRRQISEQILLLPISVDPYRLQAKIDQTGNLLIEAPVSK